MITCSSGGHTQIMKMMISLVLDTTGKQMIVQATDNMVLLKYSFNKELGGISPSKVMVNKFSLFNNLP